MFNQLKKELFMKTSKQREAIALELLPFLNSLQQGETKEVQYVALLENKITFKDLMALSDAELVQLQELLSSTLAAKEVLKRRKIYEKNQQYTTFNESEGVDYKIIF